jgi:hypothetical protein
VPLVAADHGPRALRELVMTQELVASMLGVRRESVTEAAGNCRTAGYIRYRRGHIACWTAPAWKPVFVNVTGWSRKSWRGC